MSGSASVARKAVARVAMVELPSATAGVLRECFRQFGIETCEVARDALARFAREKFEGCIVELNEKVEPVLQAVRSSPSNRRLVIYGICSSTREAMRFSRYGINALLAAPVERQDALKIVRSTHLLVIHELRLYVRLPLVTRATVSSDAGAVSASTVELSAGGMSLNARTGLPNGTRVRVQFDLPSGARISRVAVEGVVCWRRDQDGMFGVRFEASDPSRAHVKQWIDEYLEID